MKPEILQSELILILENSFAAKKNLTCVNNDYVLNLSEEDMFLLWNILGEELGIDLSLATETERKTLFHACTKNKDMTVQSLSSLLWLVYYSDIGY